MSYSVNWSSKAVEDVDAIATYIARDSHSYAAAVVSKILNITRQLTNSPLTGSIVPEFSDRGIREQCAYTYRVIYRVEDKVVTIAAVIHTKRLLGLSG